MQADVAKESGLEVGLLEKINAVFRQYPSISVVKLYGSRAKGTFRRGSDIDLALIGHDLDNRQITRIGVQLDDLMLPYSFDLTNYNAISNEALKAHIDRVGKVAFVNKVVQKK